MIPLYKPYNLIPSLQLVSLQILLSLSISESADCHCRVYYCNNIGAAIFINGTVNLVNICLCQILQCRTRFPKLCAYCTVCSAVIMYSYWQPVCPVGWVHPVRINYIMFPDSGLLEVAL